MSLKKVNEIHSTLSNPSFQNVGQSVGQGQGQASQSQSAGGYSGTLKRYLLVIKSSKQNDNICNRKAEVASALKDIAVTNTNIAADGEKITMNFSTVADRDKAANLIHSKVDEITTKNVGKIMPKITLLANDGEDENGIIDTMIQRYDYLQPILNVKDKMKVVSSKAFGHKRMYILRLEPEVRRKLTSREVAIQCVIGIM